MKSSLGPLPAGKDALRTLLGVFRRTKPEEKEKKESSQWLSRLNLLSRIDSSTARNIAESLNLQDNSKTKPTTVSQYFAASRHMHKALVSPLFWPLHCKIDMLSFFLVRKFGKLQSRH